MSERFTNYTALCNAKKGPCDYPADDSQWTSPALQMLSTMQSVWKGDASADEAQTKADRDIELQSVSDTHDHIQWKGDGTAAHPDMYNRNHFVFLPAQSSASRFVLSYYVMTVNITDPLPDENYTLVIKGFNSQPKLSCVDPLQPQGTTVPLTDVSFSNGLLSVTVVATDTPRMIVATENAQVPTKTDDDAVVSRRLQSRNYLLSPYTSSSQFTQVRFGEDSWWHQPWRAWLHTMRPHDITSGAGFNVGSCGEPCLGIKLQMMSKFGFKHGRIELGWGNQDYNNVSKIDNPGATDELVQLKKHGIRPLILLNSNSGAPAPATNYQSVVTQAAKAGETQLVLDKNPGFIEGYSGASSIDGRYIQCEYFFTKISGSTVQLSKPLLKDVPANTKITTSTFKYLPFAPTNTSDFKATISGWEQYVLATANMAIDTLGTRGQADVGFDLEVWNELTFGSDFLDINNYYSPKLYRYVLPNLR
eukprot:COSAG03_NODE_2239_length_2969_cov_4.527526_2_plen_476_part_00